MKFIKNKLLFLFFLFFSVNSFAHINLDELPKDFTKRFEVFKEAKMSKDAKALYALQLPSFKYLNSFKSYKFYVNSFVPLKSIEITKILEKNDEKIKIMVGLKLKKTKNMVYLQQNWFKVNKKYFLLTENDYVFRY